MGGKSGECKNGKRCTSHASKYYTVFNSRTSLILVIKSMLTILLLCGIYTKTDGFKWKPPVSRITSKYVSDPSTTNPDDNAPTLQQLFGGDKGVLYIQDEKKPIETKVEDNGGYLFAAATSIKRIVEIPIMPFTSPLFPDAKEMLHIYEMKFRTLMNDAEKLNGTLGRCYVSPTGSIGLIGSLCRIVEKKKMADGQGFYIIESTSRMKIRRIVNRDPYLLAEVELDYEDSVPSVSEIESAELLCEDIYILLKSYLRLARLQSVNEDSRGMIEISPAIRDARPGQIGMIEVDGGVARHRDFSHAVSHLLATEPTIMQQLFQSKSTVYRLQGIKCVLEEAISELSTLLLEDELILDEEFLAIQEAALSGDDDDLMPSEDYDGIHIDDDLSDSLSFDYGFSSFDEDFSLEDLENHILLSSDLDVELQEALGEDDLADGSASEGGPTEECKDDDDDDWDHLEAFQ